MRKKGKQGFTLLEVIIVIIILAILASVAIPRLIKTIDNAKAAEALKYLAAVRTELESCHEMSNPASYANCSMSSLGFTTNGKYFQAPYAVSLAANTFTVRMNFRTSPTVDYINMIKATATGNVVINGTGKFSSLNQ